MKQKITITGVDPLRLDLYSQHLTNLGYSPTTFISNKKKDDHLNCCCPVVMIEYQAASADNFAFVKLLKEKMPTTYVIIIAGKNDFEKAHKVIGTRLVNVIIQTRYFFSSINDVLQNIAKVPFTKNEYPGKADSMMLGYRKLYLN